MQWKRAEVQDFLNLRSKQEQLLDVDVPIFKEVRVALSSELDISKDDGQEWNACCRDIVSEEVLSIYLEVGLG